MTRAPVLSVVDYAAWDKGYMPPSEHILIDKLAYRGARVQLSTPISREHQIWVVVEGPTMNREQRKKILEIMNIWFEDEPETCSSSGAHPGNKLSGIPAPDEEMDTAERATSDETSTILLTAKQQTPGA